MVKFKLIKAESISENLIFSLLILMVSGAVLAPIFDDYSVLLSSFTDDFYYYMKVAENIALGNGSTFNGTHLTNGYHPLWLVILSVVAKFSFMTGIDPIVSAKVLVTLVVIWTFFIFYSFASAHIENKYWRLFFILFIYKWYTIYFASYGMETAITIPLFTVFLSEFIEDRSAIKTGFLASLVILSRLDAIIVLSVLFFLYFCYKGIDLKHIIKLFLGAIMIPLYIISNVYIFETPMPVSGQVKSVLSISIFHQATFDSLVNRLYANKYGYVFTAIYFSSLLMIMKLNTFSVMQRILLLTAILAPPLYYLQTSLRSDWPIWGWYLYVLPLAVLMTSVVIDKVIERKVNHYNSYKYSYISFLGVISLALVTTLIFKPITSSGKPNSMTLAAMKINSYAEEHPGVYAMGDRAGIVGYLLKSPIIQLEGLVMDTEYLKSLENSTDIQVLLQEYDVDYYIGTNLIKSDKDCYIVDEPKQSRGYSRKLVSELCWNKSLEFEISNVKNTILEP